MNSNFLYPLTPQFDGVLSIIKVWCAFFIGGVLDWTLEDWTGGIMILTELAKFISFTFAAIYTLYKINQLRNKNK